MFHRFAVFLLTPVCPSINKYIELRHLRRP
jgi:hypothetical protein